MALQVIIKALVSGLVVALASELAKRNPFFAALVVALPIGSILTFFWIHLEGQAASQIPKLSHDIFWMVLPTLVFLWLMPYFLKKISFYPAMGISMGVTVVIYLVTLWLYKKVGILS